MTQLMQGGVEAWLVDDRWSKAYALSGPETHIGRGSESSIILRDPVISRRHASVVRGVDGFELRAIGPAGTKVNGALVDKLCALREGDVIEIAFTTLRFTMMAPTGEMFVVQRDTPTTIDRMEGPTRATLAAPAVRKRGWLRPVVVVVVAMAIILLLWFFMRATTGPRV
jgi:hypothetical protein